MNIRGLGKALVLSSTILVSCGQRGPLTKVASETVPQIAQEV